MQGLAPLRTSTVAPMVALAACTLALATRRVGAASVTVVAMVGLVAVVLPAPRPQVGRVVVRAAIVAAGVLPFVLVRLTIPGPALRVTGAAVAASVVAAVAEEALFRRALYGWLRRWGAAMAVGGAALAFALVHVPVYGWGVVPIDLGAGLVFGWQRWVAGTWTVPAATHAFANLVQVL